MKYQIGDKVKYDSGDWWFYGTVTAVIENPICPSYRLNVERMVKVNCEFSITQFEFEIETDHAIDGVHERDQWNSVETEDLKNNQSVKRKKNFTNESMIEPATGAVNAPAIVPELALPVKRKRGDVWNLNLELYSKGIRNSSIHSWASLNRRLYKDGNLKEEYLIKLNEINFPFDVAKSKAKLASEQASIETPQIENSKAPKQKRNKDAWNTCFELYRNGTRSHVIHSWASQNRKLYATGQLQEEKFDRLVEINFPFEVRNRKQQKIENPVSEQ